MSSQRTAICANCPYDPTVKRSLPAYEVLFERCCRAAVPHRRSLDFDILTGLGVAKTVHSHFNDFHSPPSSFHNEPTTKMVFNSFHDPHVVRPAMVERRPPSPLAQGLTKWAKINRNESVWCDLRDSEFDEDNNGATRRRGICGYDFYRSPL